MAVIFIVNMLLSRYAIAVAGGAIDWQSLPYLILFFIWGNLQAIPGMIGTFISVNRPRDKYALWYSATLTLSILGSIVWLLACLSPDMMDATPGPVPFPPFFNLLWGLLMIVSLIASFTVAFLDIGQPDKQNP